MNAHLYLARGIVAGRVHTDQDVALARTVELVLQAERAEGRRRRILRRR
jgi:phenolic acid decarboxylase